MRKNTPIPPPIRPAGHEEKKIKFWGTIDIIIQLGIGCKSIFVVNPLVYT